MGMVRFLFHRPVTGCVVGHHYDSRWSLEGFKEGYAETNELNVTVSPETKTSLRIDISSTSKEHDDTLRICGEVDGFKTLARTTPNPFGPDTTRYYFKVTKKQGLKEMIDYAIRRLEQNQIYFFNTKLHFRFYDTDKMTINIADQVECWED